MSAKAKHRSLQVFKLSMVTGNDAIGDMIENWCDKATTHYHAYCLVCEQDVKISDRGKDGLVKHALNKKHQDCARKYRVEDGSLPKLKRRQQMLPLQSVAMKTDDGLEWKKRSLTDNVTVAETIWVASIAQQNLPFTTSDVVGDSFAAMFPDSMIAQNFSCGRVKTSQIISDGLGPHLREIIENEIRSEPLVYTAEIDETTTASHWRQFDVLVRYYSNRAEKIVVHHLKSFTLGHAGADTLKGCLIDALTPLYLRKLLQISSDGPNVMKSLTMKVKKEMNEHLVDIGQCSIHKTHNAFSSAFEVFGTRAETLALDLFQLFKYSAAHREDFEVVQKNLGIQQHVFIRHVSSRWLTLQDVTERLMEQFPAMQKYFWSLKDSQKTERINRICKYLKDPLLLVEILFLKFVLPMFTMVTRLFQSEAPLVHLLYDELSNLVLRIFQKFLKDDAIGKATGMQLYDIHYKDFNNHLKLPVIGHAAKEKLKFIFKEKKISQLQYNEFFVKAKNFYMQAASEMLRTFPLKNRLLRNLQVLHPLARDDLRSEQMVKEIAVALGGYFPSEMIDQLTDEWKVYQSEEIPEEWFKCGTLPVPSDENNEQTNVEGSYKRVDYYWSHIFNLKTSTGLKKYPCLGKLVRIALTISHGNADVERGFSFNKKLLVAGRTSLNTETISGLRTTASFLTRFDKQPKKLPMTQSLLRSVQNAHKSYMDRLERQKQAVKRRLEREENLLQKKKIMLSVEEKWKRSEKLRKEGMVMLQEACKTQDLIKMEAANAVLQNADALLHV